MYCKNCGSQVPDRARFCSNCGESLIEDDFKSEDSFTEESNHYGRYYQNETNYSTSNYEHEHYVGEERRGDCVCEDDKSSVGFGILSFFIPLIGFILFFVWKKQKPRKAKSCLIGAAIGFGIGLFTNSIYFEIIFAAIMESLGMI